MLRTFITCPREQSQEGRQQAESTRGGLLELAPRSSFSPILQDPTLIIVPHNCLALNISFAGAGAGQVKS